MPIKKRTALSLLATAGAAAAVAAVLPFSAAGGPAGLPLPDLRSDPPENQTTPEVYTDGSLIVRFDGFVTNIGPGPLHLEGNPNTTDPNNVPKQFVFDPNNYRSETATASNQLPVDPFSERNTDPDNRTGWQAVTTPEVIFETEDNHNHFHYMRIARYSLWNSDRTAEVAPGQKVGFCLYDIGAPAVTNAPPQLWYGRSGAGPNAPFTEGYNGGGDFCRAFNPGATTLQMGVSPGYRDVYDSSLALQWVNISDTAPGQYYLAAEADPDNRVVEANENNGVAFMSEPTIVPGYNALPVTTTTPYQVPVNVTLASEQFAHPNLTLGARDFRVITPPTNGVLNVTPGTDFTNPVVTYSPNPGFTGVDSFEYTAQDTDSNYPLNPRRAIASVQVGANPDLVLASISGAPASLIVGTSVQLSTVVFGGSQNVTWSVNGVPGGNATVGTVSPTGLYIAPNTVPTGGKVTIRATSVSNPTKFSERTLTIAPKPTVTPRPGKPRTLAEPRVVSGKGFASVLNTAKVAGKYRVVARYLRPGKKIRVIGRCSATRAAGKAHRCKIRYPKSLNRKFVQLVITFTPKAGGKRIVRRVGPTKIGKVRFAVAKRGTLKNRRIVLFAKVTRVGRLNVVVRHNKKVVRRCKLRVVAGQNARCQITLKRGQKPKNVRASLAMIAEDGLRVRRNARL